MLSRRDLVLAVLAARATVPGLAVAAGATDAAPLSFPRDFGAHSDSRIEWWYITGALSAATRTWGFQITFFRTATGITGADASAFRAGELVFAHAAVTDLERRRLRHDQRLARSGFGIAAASADDTGLVLRDWRLAREGGDGPSRYRARAGSDSAGFRFDLALAATQPLLLQGEHGLSRKGPDAGQVSRYYSEPQLSVRGTLALDGGEPVAVAGTAWLDHEWSDSLLAADAVGWDWIGMNLDDGGALTAFRLRRRDGSTFWAGGSHRPVGSTAVRDFAPAEVSFAPGRRWTSPATQASYPVEWRIATPAGAFAVSALLDDQELDSRASSGSVYWEGLSSLADGTGPPRRPRLSRDDRLRGAAQDLALSRRCAEEPRSQRSLFSATCVAASGTAATRPGQPASARQRSIDSETVAMSIWWIARVIVT
jgi:predicted secreted hydrolase